MDHVAIPSRAWQEGQMGLKESTREVQSGATKEGPEEGAQHIDKAHSEPAPGWLSCSKHSALILAWGHPSELKLCSG